LNAFDGLFGLFGLFDIIWPFSSKVEKYNNLDNLQLTFMAFSTKLQAKDQSWPCI
jgi:hypothetical protein